MEQIEENKGNIENQTEIREPVNQEEEETEETIQNKFKFEPKLDYILDIPGKIKLSHNIKWILEMEEKDGCKLLDFNNFKFSRNVPINNTFTKILSTEDKSCYEGQINSRNRMKHGYGKYIDSEGNYCIGYFHGDFFSEGIMILSNQLSIIRLENGAKFIDSRYRNTTLGVKGEITLYILNKSGFAYVYKGELKERQPHGVGRLRAMQCKIYNVLGGQTSPQYVGGMEDVESYSGRFFKGFFQGQVSISLSLGKNYDYLCLFRDGKFDRFLSFDGFKCKKIAGFEEYQFKFPKITNKIHPVAIIKSPCILSSLIQCHNGYYIYGKRAQRFYSENEFGMIAKGIDNNFTKLIYSTEVPGLQIEVYEYFDEKQKRVQNRYLRLGEFIFDCQQNILSNLSNDVIEITPKYYGKYEDNFMKITIIKEKDKKKREEQIGILNKLGLGWGLEEISIKIIKVVLEQRMTLMLLMNKETQRFAYIDNEFRYIFLKLNNKGINENYINAVGKIIYKDKQFSEFKGELQINEFDNNFFWFPMSGNYVLKHPEVNLKIATLERKGKNDIYYPVTSILQGTAHFAGNIKLVCNPVNPIGKKTF